MWSDAYRDHDRIIARPTAAGSRSALVSDWFHASLEPGRDCVMLAHCRADVAELNDRARALLRATGTLSDEQLTAGSRDFSIGDHVVATRNDHRADLLNGDRGTVTAIDKERSTLKVELRDGRQREISAAYLEADHLDHGYALTAHKAQGMTVDRTFVLGSDDLCTEWGYTALSRHRDEARFYVVDPDLGRTLPLDRGPDDPAVEQRLLDRSRAKELASEIADRATEPVSEIEAPPLISPERTLELAREYRARVAATERARAELAKTEEMQRDADRQLAAAEIERQETSIFDRSGRQSLDRTIAGCRQAAEYWQLQHDDREQQFNEVDAQRSEWLEQHRPEIEALLPGRRSVRRRPADARRSARRAPQPRRGGAAPARAGATRTVADRRVTIAEPPQVSPERTLELAHEYRARAAARSEPGPSSPRPRRCSATPTAGSRPLRSNARRHRSSTVPAGSGSIAPSRDTAKPSSTGSFSTRIASSNSTRSTPSAASGSSSTDPRSRPCCRPTLAPTSAH